MEVPQLRVIVFKDGEIWSAQCLEHDIGAQAPNLDELQERLTLTINIDLETSIDKHGVPFGGIDQAPQHFFDMWEKRSGDYKPARSSADKRINVDMALCA